MKKQKTFHDYCLEEIQENVPFVTSLKKFITHSENPVTEEEIFFELTTLRNRNLITLEQQEKLRDTVVGIWGLSVGSHTALTWMMESRAHTIKIADPDIISPSNLNRLRFGWQKVGKTKVSVVKKQLQEINPYATVVISTHKSVATMRSFFEDAPALHVVVDAMDDIKGKIALRQFAKKYKIPVLSATDVGDNVFLDIERYDRNPQPELFLGRVPGIETMELDALSGIERMKLILALVGLEHNSKEMLDSLLSIGTTLKTWPQLGATATIAGGVVTTAIKKIVLNEHVESGRYIFSLDGVLVHDFSGPEQTADRGKRIQEINARLAKGSK